MTTDLLIIMARYPTPGRVKTRLARDIGARVAARLYRGFLAKFACEFRDVPYDVEWHYTPARSPFRRLLQSGTFYGRRVSLRCVAQPVGPLGQRMRIIFAAAFQRGYRQVIMMGTDAPEMGDATVRRALRMLRRYPAVFQPTHDGGYALIGLREMLDVFTGIPWSTDRVMTTTRARLRCLKVRHAELPVTFDVDTKEDLARLRPRHRATD